MVRCIAGIYFFLLMHRNYATTEFPCSPTDLTMAGMQQRERAALALTSKDS
jgi:hypothetical protein